MRPSDVCDAIDARSTPGTRAFRSAIVWHCRVVRDLPCAAAVAVVMLQAMVLVLQKYLVLLLRQEQKKPLHYVRALTLGEREAGEGREGNIETEEDWRRPANASEQRYGHRDTGARGFNPNRYNSRCCE